MKTLVAQVFCLAVAFGCAGPSHERGPVRAQQDPPASAPQPPATAAEADLKEKKEQRRQFQNQELITARPFTYVFNAGDPPRIVWRDVDEVRRVGADGQLHVRWFDAHLHEVATPNEPGRWGAYIEGTAPNGTPVRRAMTFYCRPKDFLFYFPPDSPTGATHLPGPIAPDVWLEHEEEISRVSKDLFFRSLNDSEAEAVLLAGLSTAKTLGRPALTTESAAVLNDDHHLALKLKVLKLEDKIRPLQPPRKRSAGPAPVLREGSPAEAGMHPDAKVKIDALCRAWSEDSGKPFVTLVARRGIIVTHEAFGRDENDRPVGLDYRCEVFSITKTITSILFSRFMDQGLIGLDDSVASVFRDYPQGSPHVPTFRQCLSHMSGLSGHGDFGGVRHPYLENVILNAIDVNEPGKAYEYSGMGFDLAAEAMELVSGKSALHLYRDHVFQPLGLGDVPMVNASSGAQLTARELAVLAQWLANRGSYGELEFIAPETFEKLLPEPLSRRYPGVSEEEGIGMHWMRDVRPGAAPGSTRLEDRIFSAHAVGHGSLSSCILRADLDTGLVVVQVRKEAGPRFGEWSGKFFAEIADSLAPEAAP